VAVQQLFVLPARRRHRYSVARLRFQACKIHGDIDNAVADMPDMVDKVQYAHVATDRIHQAGPAASTARHRFNCNWLRFPSNPIDRKDQNTTPWTPIKLLPNSSRLPIAMTTAVYTAAG
jgi:hypothetical protein